MHLYHAAVYTSNFGTKGNIYARLDERERQAHATLEHVLESYHYVHRERYVEAMRADGRRVFLDSGAFSAFSLGSSIDIGAYCDYIHRNADVVLHASVLDDIKDPEGTWRNQRRMEDRGLSPLPCYHYGEPTEILDYYARSYPYVTIGGMVPVSSAQLRTWLDRIWEDHLVDGEGRPKVKVHGFGLTSLDLVVRYPWYSVDSSTWQAMGSYGQIILPERFAGQIHVSNNSSFRKLAGTHLDNLAPPERAEVLSEITKFGFDLGRLQDNYYSRWAFNLWSIPHYARSNMDERALHVHNARLF